MVLGFDAMDAPTTRAMAADGELPTFARLLRSWAWARTIPPYGFFASSLWPSLYTGWSPSRTGYVCWEEIVAGTYERRMTTLDSIRGVPVWRKLRDAGRRVALIDVPHSLPEDLGDGIHVSEWGCHDRHRGMSILPEAAGDELLGRFGRHPVLGVDALGLPNYAPDDYVHRQGPVRLPAEERALLAGLLAGADLKGRLSAHILGRGGWDLFMSVFGEAHAVGHQQWHLHDREHPRHDQGLAAELGDPVRQVYRAMDSVLADHLALADPDTLVLVLLSHGMGPHYDGTHLLSEVVRRLDRVSDGNPQGARLGHLARRSFSVVPLPLQQALGSGAARAIRHRVRRHAPLPVDEHDNDDHRRSQRAFMTPNNTVVGGIRLNLRGREPEGRVDPGREADEELERLRAALLRLVNVDTGTGVVRAVERTDTYYERSRADAFPDLLIEWNRDAPIETVWSPDVGVVHRPHMNWRTGDHHAHGLILARAPGLRAGEMPAVDILDIAPTLAAALGVPPGDVDGRPVSWLAPAIL